jgi:DNA modification methylase
MGTSSGERDHGVAGEAPVNRRASVPVYRTDLGAMYCGRSETLLRSRRFDFLHNQVQLVFTSPPFPLNKKKRYGNLQGEDYIEWFASYAPTLADLLTDDGSIVIEIGNAWEPGRPVMSTTVLKALLEFLERGGLSLCQEFVWYNPARLPSPVQWVNKERIRVKDAFTRIWWMSRVDRPKADNRRVLRDYSDSMKRLITSGRYNSGPRPSEYRIGDRSFLSDNGGAIPPNVIGAEDVVPLGSLLKVANTRSTDSYRDYCVTNRVPVHPARMPAILAEFFVRFLTEEGDLVLDPFAGSNTTGQAAEALGRRWVAVETKWEYASASIARFEPHAIKQRAKELVGAHLV